MSFTRSHTSNFNFSLPTSCAFVRWEAERANLRGTCEVIEHPWASGGAYVRARVGDGGTVMEFPFEVSKEETLRLYPEWWRHGEQRPARRFPEPFPRTFGPTSTVSYGNIIFFNAPATGRIGVIDAKTESLLKQIEVGGYPIDIVCDSFSAKVFVIDAVQNKVVVVDANEMRVTNEIAVPELPWSAVLCNGKLFLACIRGRCIAVVDVQRNILETTIKLEAHPYQVMVLQGEPPSLRVKLLPNIFEPVTFAEEMADRFDFYVPSRRELRDDVCAPTGLGLFERPEEYVPRRREVVHMLKLRTPAWEPVVKIFDSEKAHALRVRDTSQVETNTINPDDPTLEIRNVLVKPGDDRHYIDASKVTRGKMSLRLPFPLPGDPGPTAFDKFGKVLFFASPSLGRIGTLDMESETFLNSFDIGGYISDLVVDARSGKVYACDALGGRLIVLDAKRPEVIREIHVPSMPLSITILKGRLYVACYGDRCIAVVDQEKDAVVQVKPLPAAPLEVHAVRLFPRYTFLEAGRYPWQNFVPPDSEAPERLLVRMAHPLAFDTATFRPLDIKEEGVLAERRSEAFAAGKMFQAQACLICVDGKRWIDVASVVDPNLLPEPALLRPGDIPGTLTLAIDGGPEYDWKRNIWMDPDNELYLVNGTDEFWRWNAVTLAVGPGKHILRVRARGPFACVDAINVALAPPSGLAISVLPENSDVHSAIPFPSYHGAFYDSEPVLFTVSVTNVKTTPSEGTLKCEVRNVLGELVHCDDRPSHIVPHGTTKEPLRLDLNEWGVFNISLGFASGQKELRKEYWFLRLPKLDYPRLLFRRDDMVAIKERVRKYPRLFQRYAQWLRRHCDDSRFLPTSLLSRFIYSEYYDYLDVLAKWRALACEFAGTFVESLDEADRGYLTRKAATRLAKGYADQVTFCHNWFRAALALLYDMAAADSQQVRDAIAETYDRAWVNLERVEENLLSLREPLTPEMRLSLFQQMRWLINVDRYFTAHGHGGGGNLYASHHSLCVCPIFGTLGALLLYRNVFGIPRLFERPYLAGWLTHYRYVMPRNDDGRFFAHGSIESGGPITGVGCMDVKTMTDAVAMLTRHPLEKHVNGWDAWLAEADTASQLDDEGVDDIFGKGIGVCIPIYLALGWYEPGAQQVKWDDLPPATTFEGEGEAVMNSGWDPSATSLYFACGVRDVVTRHRAGHLRVMKAGRVLLGSPAERRGDHAQPTGSWGNVVVVGDQWQQWWIRAIGHPRGMEQNIVMNRYAPEARIYDARNEAFLRGALPESVRYDRCYILGFSEHVQNPFIKEGDIVAFETTPEFDYAAGDTTNAWASQQVIEAYRQVLFIKPNTIIVYDRLELAGDDETRWLAAAWNELSIDGKRFYVRNGGAQLVGQVLLPKDALLGETSTADYGEILKMPVIEIRPTTTGHRVEYLVAMRVSDGMLPNISALKLITDDEKIDLSISDEGAACVFRRRGEVGGNISLTAKGREIMHDFIRMGRSSGQRRE